MSYKKDDKEDIEDKYENDYTEFSDIEENEIYNENEVYNINNINNNDELLYNIISDFRQYIDKNRVNLLNNLNYDLYFEYINNIIKNK
jgi:hypothetical protein